MIDGRAPEPFASPHVGEYEDELHRSHELIHRMEHDLIQAEHQAGAERQRGGRAEKRKDRRGRRDGERESQTVRRDTEAELVNDRTEHSASPERLRRPAAPTHARCHCPSE